MFWITGSIDVQSSWILFVLRWIDFSSTNIHVFGFEKEIQIMILLWHDIDVLNIPLTPLTRPLMSHSFQHIIQLAYFVWYEW